MALYSPGGLNLADTTAPLILAYDDSGTKDVVFAVSNTGDLTITPDGGDIIFGAVRVTPTGMVITGQITGTNTGADQALFSGWNEVSGADADRGSIRIGSFANGFGRVQYDVSGQTAFYIDNTYDGTNQGTIVLRSRTLGTPVVLATFSEAGGTVLAGVLTFDGDFNHDGSAFGALGAAPQAQQAHIIDADGSLADITAKFNTLLADLEGFGFLAAA